MSIHVTGTSGADGLDPLSEDRVLPKEELSNGGPVVTDKVDISSSYHKKLATRDIEKADTLMLSSLAALILATCIGTAIGFAVGGPGGALIGFFAGFAIGLVTAAVGLSAQHKMKYPKVELKDLEDFQARLQQCQVKLKDIVKEAVDTNPGHICRDISAIRLERCTHLIKNYQKPVYKLPQSKDTVLEIDRMLFSQHYKSLLEIEDLVNSKSKKED